MPDKRKSERIEKGVKSEVYAEEHASFSSSVDLSKGGMFISTPEPLSNGSEVSMSIHMPGHGEVEIKGVVKWVRADETATEKAGMGIEFINVDGELKKKLDDLVK